MKGDASAEQITTLEDIFELNRDNQKIEQMRENVEIYEDAVREQVAPLPSKQGSKSKLQRDKRAKQNPSRINNSQRINLKPSNEGDGSY